MPETHLEFSVPLRTCPDSQSHVLILPSAAQQLRLVRSCASFCPCANHTLHDQPLALLVSHIELSHGSGFARLLVRRLKGSEILPALSDHRGAPAAAACTAFFFGMITTVGTVIKGASGAKHPEGGRDATIGQPAPRSNQISTNPNVAGLSRTERTIKIAPRA
jgi:hypothetical protein